MRKASSFRVGPGATHAAAACKGVSWQPLPASAQVHTAPALHARNSQREDFWIPPDPTLAELVFQASETHEEDERKKALDTVKRRLPDASLEEVVAVVEASAAAKLYNKPLVDAACQELVGDGGELKPEQLMAASMAFARLGHFSTDWKNVVSEQVKVKLGEFRPSLLAALVKAFGMAGYVDRGFYDLISEYVEQNIKKMGPQHLADIAFGASAGGCVTERMQSAIEKVSLEFVQQADMRESATWNEVVDSQLGDDLKVDGFSMVRLVTFGAETAGPAAKEIGLAFFMEAYTLVGCFDSNVSDRAANRCGNEMRGTDSGSLVRLMKALAKLGQDDEQLFGSIARELNDRGMHLLPHQDVASVVSVFSGLMIYNKDLMNSIVRHVLEHPEAFSEDLHKIQECCNSLGHYSAELSETVEKHGNLRNAGFQTA